jgi:hypothetical protein
MERKPVGLRLDRSRAEGLLTQRHVEDRRTSVCSSTRVTRVTEAEEQRLRACRERCPCRPAMQDGDKVKSRDWTCTELLTAR